MRGRHAADVRGKWLLLYHHDAGNERKGKSGLLADHP